MPQIPAAKAGDVVLEIVHDETGEIGHRSIVTDWSERQIDKLATGMSINLDHDNWSVVERVLDADEPSVASSLDR
jgi:sulfur relay (sulfurtransferase) DsrC/TusE family protein